MLNCKNCMLHKVAGTTKEYDDGDDTENAIMTDNSAGVLVDVENPDDGAIIVPNKQGGLNENDTELSDFTTDSEKGYIKINENLENHRKHPNEANESNNTSCDEMKWSDSDTDGNYSNDNIDVDSNNDPDDSPDAERIKINDSHSNIKCPDFNYLRCMYTNAESILGKLDEFKVQVLEERPDIISVAETWIQSDPSSDMYCPDEALEIEGYSIIRKDNTHEVRGGLLLYVSDNITTSKDKAIDNSSANFKESQWIVLHIDDVQVLYGVIYRKGASNAENNSILRDVLTKASRKYNKIIINGDLNYPEIDWVNNTVKGSDYSPQMRFYDCLMDNYLQQHVKQFTRARGSDKPSLLDLVITENSQTQVGPSLKVMAPLRKSDHAVIIFDYLVSTVRSKEPEDEIEIKSNYNKGDYKKLNDYLNNIDWKELFIDKDLDECVAILYDQVNAASKESIPTKQCHKRNSQPPWMNKRARKAIRKKYCAWSRYQQSKTYNQYLNYTKERNRTSKILRTTKKNFEKRLAEDCKRNPKALFKYANFKNKTKKNVIRLKDSNGNILTKDSENAGLLNDFFKSVHTEELDSPELTLGQAANILWNEEPTTNIFSDNDNLSRKEPSFQLTDIEITKEIIEEELKKINPIKSNTPDCIHPRIIKECTTALVDPLYHIFTMSMKEGKVPTSWKDGTITALFKDDDRHSPSNYRPVTLTSVLCRTLERVIKKSLMDYVEINNILSNHQHGFVNKRSCLSNLLSSLEEITKLYEEGFPIDEIFLDLSKAFDKVPHQRLLYKLRCLGINGNLLNWIESFLTNRRQRVKINRSYSHWSKVKSGVPQGSVLGPILFILYINDLPNTIKASCRIFADDTKLIQAIKTKEDSERLQKDLNSLAEWSDTWKLQFNPAKCHVLHIGKKNIDSTYTMNGEELVTVTEEKDLGCIISNDLKQSANIKHHISKANKLLGMIRRTFSFLDKEVFLLLYKTYIRPRLEYCQQACYPYLAKDQDALEKVQRRATKLVRTIADLPYEERIKQLGLFTLKYRRDRADLITLYKLINGHIDIDTSQFFSYVRSGILNVDIQ